MSRRGLGLIDLLVSLAIVAILMGLMLSAVKRVRGAAARIQCANRLKQQALALHMYHDTEGHLPSSMNPPAGPRPFLSWRAKILPYLEQQAIADESEASFAKQNSPFRPVPHPALGRVVPAFACPSDDRTATAWRLPTNPTLGPIAMSSYLGNSGTTSRERNGVFSTGSRTELLHITDGTSQTLLLGERPPSADLIYSWWYAGVGQGGGGKLEHHMGVVETGGRSNYHGCGVGPYAFGPGKVTEHCDAFHYWSLHDGGANFAFADGSVHFLSYAAASVLPALATRAGGESVGAFE